jgi:eukaryotic-like serine/threonine-protein kinase
MPAPTTTEELIDLIRKSGLLEEKQLDSYIEPRRAAADLPGEPKELVRAMLRDGLLTSFQSEQLLSGKSRGFDIAGKYRLLEHLGAGGMGSVFLCEHISMRRWVAIKILPFAKAKDPSYLERFYREARAVAALDHPNIVRAHDIDHDGKLHFLVMEYVDGSSLQDIITRHGPMDWQRVAHYLSQAAWGLQHAYEGGLVHRDIKPGNILVDRTGTVKVLDLGLARFFNDDDNLSKKYDETVLGTSDYLAPEQSLDSNVDIRADLYSLGATFYFCLTGQTIFGEGTAAQKLIWHQTRQPKPIRGLRPEVPEGIVAIIDKMMAKSPDQRYQTPMEVADALVAWTQTPIPPPPDNEMPQFSLAAKGSGAEVSMVPGPRTVAELSPAPRKAWQVPGASTINNPGSGPAQPSAPQPAPAREGRGATPAPVAAPAPAPRSPAPGSGAASTVDPRQQATTTQAGRPALANGAVRTASTAVTEPPVVVPTGPRRSERAAEKEPASWGRIEDEDEDDAAVSAPRRPSSARRSKRGPRGGGTNWLVWGAVGVMVLVVGSAFVLILWFALSGNREKPRPAVVREPIRVPGSRPTLQEALRTATPGDRIVLTADVTEANLMVSTKNLTIEAEPGKALVWRCPLTVGPNSKLLLIDKADGLVLKNLTLKGENRADTLLTLYGRCPGVTLEGLKLEGYRKQGILVTNCEGSSDNRVKLLGLRFLSHPGQSAISFTILPQIPDIPKNRFFIIRDCTFDGPGSKVRSGKPTLTTEPLDRDTIELPSGINPDVDR